MAPTAVHTRDHPDDPSEGVSHPDRAADSRSARSRSCRSLPTRRGIPVVCVISDDSAWGMISLVEHLIRPDEIAARGACTTDLHHMRAYEKIVAMGVGQGEQVTDPNEILPAIRRAADDGDRRSSTSRSTTSACHRSSPRTPTWSRDNDMSDPAWPGKGPIMSGT